MKSKGKLIAISAAAIVTALLFSGPAHAFRCGQKLVREKMHEIEVRKICGEPTTSANLGYVPRGVFLAEERGVGGLRTRRFPGHGRYVEEVQLTEYVYNFGPRKFMRRLLFEGGILVTIEKVGYGYVEKKPN